MPAEQASEEEQHSSELRKKKKKKLVMRVLFGMSIVFYYVWSIIGIRKRNLSNIAFYPLVFLTSVLLYFFYHRWCEQGKISSLLIPSELLEGSFMLLFSLVLPIVLIVKYLELGHTQMISALESRTSMDDSQSVKNPWRHVSVVFSSFILASLMEESLKALALWFSLRLGVKQRSSLKHAQTYQAIGIAVGLGFGTGEGIVYTCWISNDLISQIRLLLVRLLSGIPHHALYGMLWGIGLARKRLLDERGKQRSWFAIGLIPWLMHGTWDFVLMELSFIAQTYSSVIFAAAVLGFLLHLSFLVYSYYAHRHFTCQVQMALQQKNPEMNQTHESDRGIEIQTILR